MKTRIRQLGVLLAFTVVLLLGVVLLGLYAADIDLIGIVGAEETPLPVHGLSEVPLSVAEDASDLAMELYGDYQQKYNQFVTQLLAAYIEAKDKDFVLIFNSGGWGWDEMDSSPGWRSISAGIEAELDKLGYGSLLLDYRRTGESLRGVIDEFVQVLTVYPSKAERLARRVEFLTDHIPELRVIVAGESNGTVIADSAMGLLEDNPRVYSIQTGAPFWHHNVTLERTLVLNHNGITPDSFSQGDVVTMVWASLKAVVGLTPPGGEDQGRILYFLRAPGHDYRWQYPTVYHQITDFLDQNFGFRN
jgi:pimeloyl-ACP methyl ester carboxylesterase